MENFYLLNPDQEMDKLVLFVPVGLKAIDDQEYEELKAEFAEVLDAA